MRSNRHCDAARIGKIGLGVTNVKMTGKIETNLANLSKSGKFPLETAMPCSDSGSVCLTTWLVGNL